MFDIRNMYKGEDLVLQKKICSGPTKITGVVVSDHSGNNLPKGITDLTGCPAGYQKYAVLQYNRRCGCILCSGDSLIIDVAGKTLTRIDGIVQITSITTGDINKVATGGPFLTTGYTCTMFLKNPDDYESVLSIIVKSISVP